MTRRERLMRCYARKPTDRPAIYSRPGFPREDPTYDRLRAYLREYTELKSIWPVSQFESKLPIRAENEPYSDDFERRIEWLETPTGVLRRSFLVGLRGQPGLHETFFVNCREDAEKFLSLPLPSVAGDTSGFAEMDAAVGDTGIVDVDLGMNPAGYVAELCGSENFAILSVTDRDILHRLCARRLESMLTVLAFLLERDIGPVFSLYGEEYLVPPLHGPLDFTEFNTRYDKPIVDRVHEARGYLHVHCHGSVKRVLKGFLDSGIDVLHPFEAPPQGDILAGEAKAIVRGCICFEGNIQIHRMYEATPESVREEALRLVEDAFDDETGLIVSPTASPYIRGAGEVCFPQYRAMIDAVLGYRKR